MKPMQKYLHGTKMKPKGVKMAAQNTQADWVKTALRLPRDLHREVHEDAKKNDRTFNGQIVATLRQASGAAEQGQAKAA